ncbi:hypothetical protein DVH05_008907 [Phytophthora capsici]|nr:hypothetical protein DVH05_008907 [Phytophthora capsici]
MALAEDELKKYFFSGGQYLIADSAYPADTKRNTLVPAYRKNQHGHDNSAFNTCVAHVRVVNEHTIGVQKARWTSLREIRLQIKRKEDVKRLLRWVNACVVLHNMFFTLGDGCPEGREVDDDLPTAATGYDHEMFPFRCRLKRHAVAVGRKPGNILWLRAE